MEGVWWGGSVDWRLGRAGCLTANVRYPACWCFSSRLAGRQYDNFAYRLQGPGMIPFVKLVVQPSTVPVPSSKLPVPRYQHSHNFDASPVGLTIMHTVSRTRPWQARHLVADPDVRHSRATGRGERRTHRHPLTCCRGKSSRALRKLSCSRP